MQNETLIIERTFNAPRELVYQAWTDAEKLTEWWGPKGVTAMVKQLDVQPGGVFHYMNTTPDGMELWGKFVYRELVPPEKIVFISCFSDPEGNTGANPWMQEWPQWLLNILTLTDEGGKTKMRLEVSPVDATQAERDAFVGLFGSMQGGYGSMFDKLDELLVKDQAADEPFVIERLLNAPVELVWKAISDRDEMAKWYFDLKAFRPEVGFAFEFIGCADDNTEYRHLCVVIEVVPNERLTYSWRYDGYEGNSLVTFELFPVGDKTRIRLTHTGLGTFPASNKDFARSNFAAGWTHIIGTALLEFLDK